MINLTHFPVCSFLYMIGVSRTFAEKKRKQEWQRVYGASPSSREQLGMELLLFQIMNALIYSNIIMSTSLNQILLNMLSLSLDPTLNLKYYQRIFSDGLQYHKTSREFSFWTFLYIFPRSIPKILCPLCCLISNSVSSSRHPLCQSPSRVSEAFWICPICQSIVRVYAT